MPIRSKKVYEADLILCPRTVEELATVIDSVVDYDCFLVNRDQAFDGSDCKMIQRIASQKSDWIEIFGYNAEKIHDAIDAASVACGRQPSAGFGVPMTSWNDYECDEDVIEYLQTGGHGASSTKLLIFLGTDDEEKKFWGLLHSKVS